MGSVALAERRARAAESADDVESEDTTQQQPHAADEQRRLPPRPVDWLGKSFLRSAILFS